MPHQEGSTCNLKYKSGGEEILKLQESMTAPKTDVVYLTCEATAPRRACKVQLTVPKRKKRLNNGSGGWIFSVGLAAPANESRWHGRLAEVSGRMKLRER